MSLQSVDYTELSLGDKVIAACKAGVLVSVQQLLDVILQQRGVGTQREVQQLEDEDVTVKRTEDMTLEQDGDAGVVEWELEEAVGRDGDLTISCDEEKTLNLIVNQDGETVLHAAAVGGHPAIVAFLLSRGANPAVKYCLINMRSWYCLSSSHCNGLL